MQISKTSVKNSYKHFFSQEYFHSPLVQWVIIGAIFVNVVNWVLVAFFNRPVDFPIILHYNVYFGVDVIGAWWQVYSLPAIGLVILLVNTILGYSFYCQKERIISHLLMLGTLMVQIIMTIAVACILTINY